MRDAASRGAERGAGGRAAGVAALPDADDWLSPVALSSFAASVQSDARVDALHAGWDVCPRTARWSSSACRSEGEDLFARARGPLRHRDARRPRPGGARRPRRRLRPSLVTARTGISGSALRVGARWRPCPGTRRGSVAPRLGVARGTADAARRGVVIAAGTAATRAWTGVAQRHPGGPRRRCCRRRCCCTSPSAPAWLSRGGGRRCSCSTRCDAARRARRAGPRCRRAPGGRRDRARADARGVGRLCRTRRPRPWARCWTRSSLVSARARAPGAPEPRPALLAHGCAPRALPFGAVARRHVRLDAPLTDWPCRRRIAWRSGAAMARLCCEDVVLPVVDGLVAGARWRTRWLTPTPGRCGRCHLCDEALHGVEVAARGRAACSCAAGRADARRRRAARGRRPGGPGTRPRGLDAAAAGALGRRHGHGRGLLRPAAPTADAGPPVRAERVARVRGRRGAARRGVRRAGAAPRPAPGRRRARWLPGRRGRRDRRRRRDPRRGVRRRGLRALPRGCAGGRARLGARRGRHAARSPRGGAGGARAQATRDAGAEPAVRLLAARAGGTTLAPEVERAAARRSHRRPAGLVVGRRAGAGTASAARAAPLPPPHATTCGRRRSRPASRSCSSATIPTAAPSPALRTCVWAPTLPCRTSRRRRPTAARRDGWRSSACSPRGGPLVVHERLRAAEVRADAVARARARGRRAGAGVRRGALHRAARTEGRPTAGTDVSELARRANAAGRCDGLANVELRRLDLFADELPGELELVVCSEVLYYAPDRDASRPSWRGWRRALRPGGVFVTAHANVVADDPPPGLRLGRALGAAT